ncbi:amino acid ABC transporter permease [Aureimonas jatrophae]|uniref:General L-amino acid transport system permease protein n=1 Tax=Aureimonas jatrophae TaxID=1166073 RepID=A0A1H0JLC7_9HYPH|nr:amino acid ABC transporter permease [Aureimonas jatrophae]MBB3951341.1 general L-amino acid transport system permease protein [Aureimonas jatrophae]SDO44615.1 general L-amino acid transport system permease protein [Aureimonas jatrophae]
MEEQVASYAPRGGLPALPPPVDTTSPFARLRTRFFATPLDAALSILFGLLAVYIVWSLVQWAIVDAVFVGNDRTACLDTPEREVGACWAFVAARFSQFIYGLYPIEQRWRVDWVFGLGAVLIALVAIPRVPFKKLFALLLLGVYPLVVLVLLTGGQFDMSGSGIAIVFMLAAAATIFLAFGRSSTVSRTLPMKIALWLTVLSAVVGVVSFYYAPGGSESILTFRFNTFAQIAFYAALVAIVLALVATIATADDRLAAVRLLVPTAVAIAFVLILTAPLGIPHVPTNLWGGLLVTLVVALTGIAFSLPLGILLALGRQSSMPAVRFLSVVFIEFWRGVPLITVLFMANFMLPLLLPQGVSFNQLLRVLVGVSLFAAAYMAEVIRGGLQAIPKGQYEGADAMALTYWQKMRMIILPQALTLVIPGIVNTFIGLFKDTSLVYIIGLADLLGTIRRGFNDPVWITPSTPATGLVFGAFAFWLFCFSMSRYSIFIEGRLARGRKH